MTRESGPTIARWQLGAQLRSLREAVGLSQVQIADVLGCSESKIYKLESGDVGVGRGDLLVMLDRYQVTDAQLRETILDLQRQGRQRGWWSRYGQIPHNYSMYVGLEGAATTVRNFELAVVPGLLQTERYAHTVISASRPDNPGETDRRVRLRIERQRVLVSDPSLEYWTIMDEAVLRRWTGGQDVMRGQLAHLLEMGEKANVTIQGWSRSPKAGTPARWAPSTSWSSPRRSIGRSSTQRRSAETSTSNAGRTSTESRSRTLTYEQPHSA